MAHVSKHTRAASGHLFKHYERAKDENGDYLHFNNQDIDSDRTAQNYNLAPERDGGQMEFVHKRCREVKCLKRKDVNVMCSWIVTAPQYIADNPEAGRKFFSHTYQFLTGRYNEENTVSAYVHMDEITPHMHFAFVPVIADKKTKKLKVSAKELVDRSDLQTFHTDLDRHLMQTMGELYHGGILNGATLDGNRSIEELKRQSASDRLAQAESQAANIREEAEEKVRQLIERERKLKDDLSAIRMELKAVQGQTASYKGVISTASDIEGMGKKSVFGDKITFTAKEAKLLKDQALAYWAAKSDAEKSKDDADRIRRRYFHLEKVERETVPKLRRQVRSLTMERDEIGKNLKKTLAVIESNIELKKAFKQQLDIFEQQDAAQKKQKRLRYDLEL